MSKKKTKSDTLTQEQLENLTKAILERKKAIFNALLSSALEPKALLDVDKLEKALNQADREEIALNRLRATADHVLADAFKQKLKAGLVRE